MTYRLPPASTTLDSDQGLNPHPRRFTWRDKVIAWVFGRVRCAYCDAWAEVERGPLCIFTDCLLLTCRRCNLADKV